MDRMRYRNLSQLVRNEVVEELSTPTGASVKITPPNSHVSWRGSTVFHSFVYACTPLEV